MIFRISTFLSLLFLASCGSLRKISYVDFRQPASTQEVEISEERIALGSTEVPNSCPIEIKENFTPIITAYVPFPACPPLYKTSFESSLNYLKIDERAVLEEVLKSNCRSLGWGSFGDSLESILQNFETTGPIGRRKEEFQTLTSMENESKALLELKKQIEEIVFTHLPLDRWVRAHGQMIIPELYLQYLNQMMTKNRCSISEEQFDVGFQLVKDLQELNSLLGESETQKKSVRLLEGFKIILDKKIGEYFKP